MDAYLWLAPCLILLILFVLTPVLEVFRMAFSKISPANLLKEFGTLENFQYLFRQKVFGRVMLNTAIWTVAIVGISIVLSIILALVLNEKLRAAHSTGLFCSCRGQHRCLLLRPHGNTF